MIVKAEQRLKIRNVRIKPGETVKVSKEIGDELIASKAASAIIDPEPSEKELARQSRREANRKQNEQPASKESEDDVNGGGDTDDESGATQA